MWLAALCLPFVVAAMVVASFALGLFASSFAMAVALFSAATVASSAVAISAASSATSVLGLRLWWAYALRQFGTRYLNFECALDVRQCIQVLFANQRDGTAFASGACGAANAVYVVLGIVWRIVVDDHGNVVNVDASCHNVGGNEQVHFVCTEQIHDFIALGLCQIGVHGARIQPAAFQHNGQFFYLLL